MRALMLGRRPLLRAIAIGLSAVATGAAWLAGTAATPAQAAVVTLATFNYTGHRVSWTVPSGVSKVTFTLYGGSGGNVLNGSTVVAVGGGGGEASGQFKVKPGETFEISVGGAGQSNSGTSPGLGGFNGGGYGGSGGTLGGGAGGGASDVRIGGKGNPCASTTSCDVMDRILVAGGGGGAGVTGDGGSGGGINGGGAGGYFGEQEGIVCPTGGSSQGCFGRGGFGGGGSGGGGGGGWFGGSGSYNFGGGGGSGYISSLASKASFPAATHSGYGEVIITTP